MRSLLLLVAVMGTLFTSCIKNLDSNVKPDALKAITLTEDTVSMIQGDSTFMNYSLTPANYDQSLAWHASDTTVVAIMRGGKICAKNIGVSLVTISNREKTVSVSALVIVSHNLSASNIINH